jgi:predicted amidohydrolase YtcJ
MHVHAVSDEVTELVIGTFAEIDAEIPVRPLHFSLAHGDLLADATIATMARLGVGLVVDDRQVFRADASEAAWGPGSLTDVPNFTALDAAGITLGLGTDATRASSLNPWLALWWLVAGRSIDGRRRRGEAQLLGRARALGIMTAGNAAIVGEADRRGRLAPGLLADLAVLDEDYFTLDEDGIGALRAELTIVGGAVVHSTGTITDPTTGTTTGATTDHAQP